MALFHNIGKRCLKGIYELMSYIYDILVGEEHSSIMKELYSRLEKHGFHATKPNAVKGR